MTVLHEISHITCGHIKSGVRSDPLLKILSELGESYESISRAIEFDADVHATCHIVNITYSRILEPERDWIGKKFFANEICAIRGIAAASAVFLVAINQRFVSLDLYKTKTHPISWLRFRIFFNHLGGNILRNSHIFKNIEDFIGIAMKAVAIFIQAISESFNADFYSSNFFESEKIIVEHDEEAMKTYSRIYKYLNEFKLGEIILVDPKYDKYGNPNN